MSLSQKWKDTVDKGMTDKRWDQYDSLIKKEVEKLKIKLTGTTLPSVNWLLIKAMLWVESGGPDNPAWNQRAMQIGNPGDPGLQTLKNGAEGSDLIVDSTLLTAIKGGRTNEPEINIKAGMAYLYTRMAKSEIKSVRSKIDKKNYDYIVVVGDSLDKIARKNGTTVEELKSMNPKARMMIRPGDKLKYVKASMIRVITGWRSFNSTTMAQRYNVGDSNYSAKLDYLIKNVFPNLVRTP